MGLKKKFNSLLGNLILLIITGTNMKKFIGIFVAVILMFSCSNEETSKASLEEDGVINDSIGGKAITTSIGPRTTEGWE